MKDINIFFQIEGNRAQQHIEAPPDETLAQLKQRIADKYGITGTTFLFIEDAEEPADETKTIGAIATGGVLKANVHHCARIAVKIAFGARLLEHTFGPGTTVARVKAWAAKQLGMSDEDAGEHVLQLTGTHDRPTPSTHIGALATHPSCQVAFDLVANERVQG